MGDYRELSDEEIILLIRNGEEPALEYLLNKYKNLVRGKANTLFLIGGEREDLIQEGMIGLYSAIRDFDEEKNTSFYTFAELCTTRRMYTAISASMRQKNQPLNDYISFDGQENSEIASDIKGTRNENPEELMIHRENMEFIEKRLRDILSPLERSVLSLYLENYNYEQMSRQLNRSVKAVDNAIQRIRKKLNQMNV